MRYIIIIILISISSQCSGLKVTKSVSNSADSNYIQTSENIISKNDSILECQSDLKGKEHLHKAYDYLSDLKYSKAISHFKCAFDKGEGSFNDKIEYIRTLYISEKYDDVIEQCNVLLRQGKDELVVHKFLADSLIKTQRYEEALREIKISQTFDLNNPNSINYLYKKALALDGLGNKVEALEAFEKYIAKANDCEPRLNRIKYAEKRILILKQHL